MANTYVLIASNVLGSSASSVTLSSIPQTYKDLHLVMSTRETNAAIQAYPEVRPNGVTGYSNSRLYTGNTDASTGGQSQINRDGIQFLSNGANSTSNTFALTEMYFPSYTGSTKKVISSHNVQENNSTTANQTGQYIIAGLTNATTAISSIQIVSFNQFVAGSSFHLYGIKNS